MRSGRRRAAVAGCGPVGQSSNGIRSRSVRQPGLISEEASKPISKTIVRRAEALKAILAVNDSP